MWHLKELTEGQVPTQNSEVKPAYGQTFSTGTLQQGFPTQHQKHQGLIIFHGWGLPWALEDVEQHPCHSLDASSISNYDNQRYPRYCTVSPVVENRPWWRTTGQVCVASNLPYLSAPHPGSLCSQSCLCSPLCIPSFPSQPPAASLYPPYFHP